MNILIVSSNIPYPPTDGGRIGVFFPLRELARRGHRITFACLAESVTSEQRAAMEEWSKLIVVQHKKKANFVGAIRSLFSRYPYTLSRFHNETLVKRILQETSEMWDIAEIEGLHNAYNGLHVKAHVGIPTGIRLHNVESVILERYRAFHKNPFVRLFLLLETWKMKRYERQVLPLFDFATAVTVLDKEATEKVAPSLPIKVIPAGVDTERIFLEGITEEPHSLLWMGALNWPPNLDSLQWFLDEIFPLVLAHEPTAMLHVVGSNPPENLSNRENKNVRIWGFVEDTRAMLQMCPVCVVPLRSGGGIRLKILEFLFMKRGVVSTSVGSEGIDVVDGRDLMLADTPRAFADAILDLLRRPQQARTLGENGRRLVETRYSWRAISQDFESLFDSMIQQHR